MDSVNVAERGSRAMNRGGKGDSLQYFVAMIAQMATTLREFGMPDAATSLETARAQIEAKLAENKKDAS
jgi:hypothetical protein